MYSMYDTHGRGDSGEMSMALIPIEGRGFGEARDFEHDARPRIGVVMRVGAAHTTMFGADTWLQTSVITEILEESYTKVVFKTKSGSVYTWEIK